jgi:hypothetical protein
MMSPTVAADPWGSVTVGEGEAAIAKVDDGAEVVGDGGREGAQRWFQGGLTSLIPG